MTEQNNNYFNNNQYIANEYQKQHQDVKQDAQVEWISKFVLECPEVALTVDKYLQKTIPISSNRSHNRTILHANVVIQSTIVEDLLAVEVFDINMLDGKKYKRLHSG